MAFCSDGIRRACRGHARGFVRNKTNPIGAIICPKDNCICSVGFEGSRANDFALDGQSPGFREGRNDGGLSENFLPRKLNPIGAINAAGREPVRIN